MFARGLVPRVTRELSRRKAALIWAVGESRAARGVAYARDLVPRVRERLGWGVDGVATVVEPPVAACEVPGGQSRRLRSWALDWDGNALLESGDDGAAGGPAYRN